MCYNFLYNEPKNVEMIFKDYLESSTVSSIDKVSGVF